MRVIGHLPRLSFPISRTQTGRAGVFVQRAIRRAQEVGDGEAKGVGEFFTLNNVKKYPWGAMSSMEM